MVDKIMCSFCKIIDKPNDNKTKIRKPKAKKNLKKYLKSQYICYIYLNILLKGIYSFNIKSTLNLTNKNKMKKKLTLYTLNIFDSTSIVA